MQYEVYHKKINDEWLTVSKNKLKNGVLIAIEGIDGAGKTTQTKFLQKTLIAEGYDAISFKEPTDGKWGMKIKDIAMNGRENVTPEDELNYFILDRKEDVANNINPTLKDKKIVIMDRYYYSNMAYQGALGVDVGYIQKENETQFPIPNIVIILDVAPKIGISRIKNLRKEKPNKFEGETYLADVRKIFHEMDQDNIQIIDGTRSIEEVEKQMLNIIHDVIFPLLNERN